MLGFLIRSLGHEPLPLRDGIEYSTYERPPQLKVLAGWAAATVYAVAAFLHERSLLDVGSKSVKRCPEVSLLLALWL